MNTRPYILIFIEAEATEIIIAMIEVETFSGRGLMIEEESSFRDKFRGYNNSREPHRREDMYRDRCDNKGLVVNPDPPMEELNFSQQK